MIKHFAKVTSLEDLRRALVGRTVGSEAGPRALAGSEALTPVTASTLLEATVSMPY